MRMTWPLAIVLTLGACAGLTGGNPALYQSLADSDVRLASRTMPSTLERAPDGSTRSWANRQPGALTTRTQPATAAIPAANTARSW